MVIIEKRPTIGGNISMTEGMFGNGSALQKEAGIEPASTPASSTRRHTTTRCPEGMIGYCVYSGRHAAAHIMDNME